MPESLSLDLTEIDKDLDTVSLSLDLNEISDFKFRSDADASLAKIVQYLDEEHREQGEIIKMLEDFEKRLC